MSFDPTKVRLERLKTDLHYHAAYNYLSLKGVLAERWAHGPIFGALADLGNQVKLTPESGFDKDRVEGMYGLRYSYFDRELVRDRKNTNEQTLEWFGDVIDVFDPRVITKVSIQYFALYPLSNIAAAESATQKLRRHYYNEDKIDGLLPQGFDHNFVALDGLCLDHEREWHLVVGAVGPPHKGRFFGVADPQRDENWWMGLNFHLVRKNDEGLGDGDPMSVIENAMNDASAEYDRLVMQALGSVLN